MDTIQATVTHDGKWWVADFTVDGHEYGTQARSLSTMREMVADAAALMTDRPTDAFTVTLVPADQEAAALVSDYRSASAALTAAQKATADTSRRAVARLRGQGVSGRDIAALMGLSPQRVSQLA